MERVKIFMVNQQSSILFLLVIKPIQWQMANHADGTEATVNFIVGGVYYSLLLSDIQTHKDSYFASVIKDEWNRSDEPIVIDRDGVLFQHIIVYIYNRRYKMPFTVHGSLSLLVSVRREADYYNLPELVAACDETYEREMTKWCKTQPLQELCDAYTLQSEEITELDALVSSEVYPGCHTGTLDKEQPASENVITEALAAARVPRNSEMQQNLFHLTFPGSYDSLEWLQLSLPSLPGVRCCLTGQGGGFFAVKEDGYQKAITVGVQSAHRIGTALYILNSPHTGGVITVSKNGVSKSINQPGEFILYTCDYTRTISTVTSGALVFAKFDIVRDFPAVYGRDCSDYVTPRLTPYNLMPCTMRDLLVQAVHSELSSSISAENNNGVVLCLSTLYPIVEFDPSGPHLETDSDSLQDRDAELYEYLKDTFAVSLVTLCVQRGSDETAGCVLGPPPTEDTECAAKVKIIAPFHGFRDSFEMCKVEAKSTKVMFCNLFTALYIAKK